MMRSVRRVLTAWLPRRPLPYWLAALLIALAYVLSGHASLPLAIPPGYATAFFLPSGVALTCLLMGGYRLAPAVWVGSLVLNLTLVSGPISTTAMVVAAGIASGSTLQACVGCFFVRRVAGPEPRLQRLAEIARMLLACGPFACLIAASCATAVLLLTHTIPLHEAGLTWLIWWVGDMLGVLVGLPLLLAVCNWPQATWQGRRHTVLWPLVVCLTAVVALFVRVSQYEQTQLQTEFLRQAERTALSTKTNLLRYLQSAQATRRFVEVTDRESADAFRHFVRGELELLPGLRSVSWAPRVAYADVGAYEAQLRARAGSEATLREWQSTSSLQPAQPRPEYYPLTFVESSADSAPALGADLLSEPTRSHAVLSALAQDDLAISGRIHMLGDEDSGWSALAIVPVHEPSTWRVVGVVSSVLRLESIVRQNADLEHSSELKLSIWDVTTKDSTAQLYGAAETPPGNEPLVFRLPVVLGDRTWELRVVPAQQISITTTRRWQTWAVLIAGVLFSGLLTVLLLDQSGEKTRVAALVAERTETLHQREQFLSAVLQSALDGLLTLDSEGRVRSANPAAVRLLGLSPLGAAGMPLSEVLPRLDWPPLLAELERLPPESLGIRRETHARRRDGSEVPVELALSNASASGARTYVCLLHDVSERARVAQMKDEFVSTVSHELRTPLTSILGALGLINRGGLGAQADAAPMLLTIAESNAQRLLHLINDLLDVDKMEAGQLDLECKVAELAPLLSRSLEENRGYAERFQVALRLLPGVAPGALAEVDETRFAQIMSNLLSNAIKFSSQGSAVEVDLAQEPEWVEVIVRDSGAGIPAHFQPLLFRKFSQADSSDTRRQRGTGLGLYLTRLLVERMHGSIRFETAEGQGTTFFVRLPRAPG
jgi:PAS domain S-box-containing protein